MTELEQRWHALVDRRARTSSIPSGPRNPNILGRSIVSWRNWMCGEWAVGWHLDGDFDMLAFLAEHPDNPYLYRWGWWDQPLVGEQVIV